jgi:LuxR family maltose regulon positive regulatory protein
VSDPGRHQAALRALPASLDNPLLATKLLVPPGPSWQLARRRLLDLLTRGAEGPLTLLAAPAGSGKTMLLGSWIRAGSVPGPVAWVSLDADDNDPYRFWAYVLAGLRASGAVADDSLLAGLAPPTPGNRDTFVPLLVNGLGELPGPVVVVLDDLHELNDARVLAGLDFLVRHAPAQLRLVLASRTDPSLRLARRRAAGAVTEVRAAELAFTRAEAAELLAALGAGLSDGEVEALWTRTEGWAAGLRLAALSLREHPDPSGFVAEFSGDDRTVAGYLLGEVLYRQPADVRDFLLRTSVADQLTGELADALTGGRDGAQRLAALERANAFVVPLDLHRTAYRYHHLFAELLRTELLYDRGAEEVAQLHRRAARWHAADGVTVDAIRHAMAAGDWDHVRALLVERWGAMAATITTLDSLLRKLPDDLVGGDPELAMIAAISRLDVGDLDAAEAYLRLAEANAAAVPDERRTWFAAGLTQIRMHRARLLGDLDGVTDAARTLLELSATVDEVSPWSLHAADLRTAGLSNLGTAELWNGEVEAAARHFEESLQAATRDLLAPAEEFPVLNCMSQLALVEAVRGRLGHALERGREAIAFAERRGWSESMQAFGGHLALAWASYHRGNLGAAGRHLDAASKAARERMAVVATALVRGWVLTSRGQARAGLTALRGAVVATQGRAGWQPPPVLADLVRVSEARLLIAVGDTQAALGLLGKEPAGWHPEAAVVVARLQLADGDPAGAAATLAAHVHGSPAAAAHPFVLLEAELVDAVARAGLGEDDEAARRLEAGLAVAAREGYRQVFADGGAPLHALLVRQLQLGTEHPSLVAELLGTADQRASHASSSLVDPLSDRELTVLRYLASVLSTAEIAAELNVSSNTVKTHVKSIYRKLDANGRRDAVDHARRLGLL